MEFSNPFFSIAGQKERLTNVVNVFSSIFSGGEKKAAVGLDIKAPELIVKVAEAIIKNPIISAGAVAVGIAAAPVIAANAPSVIKAATPVVKSVASSKAGAAVVTTAGALALTNPSLITSERLGTGVAFALNPIAASIGYATSTGTDIINTIKDPTSTLTQKAKGVGQVITDNAITGAVVAGGALAAGVTAAELIPGGFDPVPKLDIFGKNDTVEESPKPIKEESTPANLPSPVSDIYIPKTTTTTKKRSKKKSKTHNFGRCSSSDNVIININ